MQKKRKLHSGFQARGAACAACAAGYLLADSLAVRAARHWLKGWLAGSGAGACTSVYEQCTWAANLLTAFVALAVPVLAAVWLGRLNQKQIGLRAPGRRLLVPALWLYLGFGEAANLAAAAIGEKTGSMQSITLPENAGAVLLAFLTICAVPAVGEELLFRGAARAFLRPYGAWVAVWGQAVLFALLHQKLSAIFFALPSGLFFGYLAEASGSLWPGMVLHFINNVLAFGLLYLHANGFGNIAGYAAAAEMIVFPLMAAVTAVKLKRRKRHTFPPLARGVSPLRLLQCVPWMLTVAGLTLFCLLGL